MVGMIAAIDKQSVHRICSGQVVLDLATAVKELVENSIDAGATSVDINFKDSGLEGLEIVDDGSGIDPMNYETLALKHYTSKLSSFEDLERVITFGFRGEALSSLCALAQLTVITATKEQAPMGVKLEYDHNGALYQKNPISRQKGTTIQLTGLFQSLPVRLAEFKRNIKREYGKALTMIQAYSIISTNVRISVNHQSSSTKKASNKVMSTSRNKEISANISNVFGAKLVSQIMPFDIDLSLAVNEGSKITGYISKPEWGVGRSSADRQYLFVNGRPCVLSKIAKAMNEVYRSFISNQYPVVIANLLVPTDAYDVNVSPDKRTIFIHQENKIVECILDQLREIMEPSRSTFQVNALMSPSSSPLSVSESISTSSSVSHLSSSTTKSMASTLSSYSDSPTPSRVKSISSLGSFAMSSGNSFRSQPSLTTKKRIRPDSSAAHTTTSTLLKYMSSKKVKLDQEEVSKKTKTKTESSDQEMDELDDDSSQEHSSIASNLTIARHQEVAQQSMSSATEMDGKNHTPVEVDTREYIEVMSGIKSFSGLQKTVGRIVSIKPMSLDQMLAALHASTTSPIPSSFHTQENSTATFVQASVANTQDNVKATHALSRIISKPDFARMQIIGQFNLGFMITSLDDQDLYIIDQHASDEKYNFEALQKTTEIKSQRLIQPPILDLTAAEEHVVMDNLDVFKANGFDVEVLSENEPTRRIRVISQPFSKNTMFDQKDFSEIIFLIHEKPGDRSIKCSRNRAMFASRACHKATRIGDSLTMPQMTKIVRHMGEIDQPWVITNKNRNFICFCIYSHLLM
ncbi:hypothetical protein BD560DRAFT_412104 [Blakeslea trispora]|nr:hypothetical protein BD560DRAFT_412104 [Blakeslea trispora]